MKNNCAIYLLRHEKLYSSAMIFFSIFLSFDFDDLIIIVFPELIFITLNYI